MNYQKAKTTVDVAEYLINPAATDLRLGTLGSAEPTSTGEANRFIGCPISWLLRVLSAVKGKQELVVAIYLWRRHIICQRRKTFDVPNGELESWGIPRQTKYRALARLDAAGVLAVRRKGKDALTVTILPAKRKRQPGC